MREFDSSQVLYRLAFASGLRAANRAEQSTVMGGDAERNARSFDACVEAVVLLQASAEAWVFRLFETRGVEPRSDTWLGRWNGLGHVAQAQGRSMRSLSKESRDLLEEVSRIRNFLMHGDLRSRQRLEKWAGDRDLHDILTYEYIATMFQRAESLWKEARDITGASTPFSDSAWIATDEFQ
jgi:hypothetical protein